MGLLGVNTVCLPWIVGNYCVFALVVGNYCVFALVSAESTMEYGVQVCYLRELFSPTMGSKVSYSDKSGLFGDGMFMRVPEFIEYCEVSNTSCIS